MCCSGVGYGPLVLLYLPLVPFYLAGNGVSYVHRLNISLHEKLFPGSLESKLTHLKAKLAVLVLASKETQAHLHGKIASLLLLKNALAEAQIHIQKAIELVPAHYLYVYYLSIIQGRLQQRDNMIASMEKAISLLNYEAPKKSVAKKLLHGFADSVETMNDSIVEKRDSVVQSIVEALPAITGNTHAAVQLRGEENNYYKTMMAGFSNITKSSIANNISVMKLGERNNEEAIKYFTLALKHVDSSSGDEERIYYFNLGIARYYNLEWTMAEPCFRQVIKRTSETSSTISMSDKKLMSQAMDFCANCHMRLGNEQEANKLWNGMYNGVKPAFHYRLLPTDMVLEIMKFLGPRELGRAARSCNEFYKFSKDPVFLKTASTSQSVLQLQQRAPFAEHLIVTYATNKPAVLPHIKKITMKTYNFAVFDHRHTDLGFITFGDNKNCSFTTSDGRQVSTHIETLDLTFELAREFQYLAELIKNDWLTMKQILVDEKKREMLERALSRLDKAKTQDIDIVIKPTWRCC